MRSSRKTKYAALAEKLEADIVSGKYAVGDKFSSERQLVEISGLSLLTVRQSMNVLAKRGLIVRRQGAGSFVISQKPVEQQLWLAVLLMHFDKEMLSGYQFIYSSWMKGICRATDEVGAHLSVVDLAIADDPLERFQRMCKNDNAPAGFLMPLAHRWMMPFLLGSKGRKAVPHAVIPDRDVDERLNFVTVDLAGAGRDAAEYFYNQGHRRMAYVGAKDNLREAGWIEGLKGLGIYENNQDLVTPDPKPSSVLMVAEDNGYEAGLKLLRMKDRPTAVFCMNDSRARGLLRAAKELDVNVPRELSVIGFDNMPGSGLLAPPLTTFAPDWEAVGYEAAKLVIKWLERGKFTPKNKRHKVPLLVRESTAQAP